MRETDAWIEEERYNGDETGIIGEKEVCGSVRVWVDMICGLVGRWWVAASST